MAGGLVHREINKVSKISHVYKMAQTLTNVFRPFKGHFLNLKFKSSDDILSTLYIASVYLEVVFICSSTLTWMSTSEVRIAVHEKKVEDTFLAAIFKLWRDYTSKLVYSVHINGSLFGKQGEQNLFLCRAFCFQKGSKINFIIEHEITSRIELFGFGQFNATFTGCLLKRVKATHDFQF